MNESKIKLTRLDKELPKLNGVQFITNDENDDIQFHDVNELPKYGDIPSIVNDFKFTNANGNLFSYNKASSLCSDGFCYLSIDGKDNVYLVNDSSLFYNKVRKQYIQPFMTSDTTPYGVVSASDMHNPPTYQSWKAFNGTNINESDCWHAMTDFVAGRKSHWLQYELVNPITPEKFVIGNRNNTSSIWTSINFEISGRDLDGNWDILVKENSTTATINMASSAMNDWYPKQTNKLYNAFKFESFESGDIFNGISSGYVCISRFIIIGEYNDYLVPDQKYNAFMIKENGVDRFVLSDREHIDEVPSKKIGWLKTDYKCDIIDVYPKITLVDELASRNILAENKSQSLGYRIYSDGWKQCWGTNANPTFPIVFNDKPLIVSRGASNVSNTGMTIVAGWWKAEGY